MHRTKIIGITGLAGCGKSTAARLLAERGATVIDADQLAHGALNETAILTQLRAIFPPLIFNADATVNRAALGKIVFRDAEKLAALEAIIHPAVQRQIVQQIAKLQAVKLLVIEAALLKLINVDFTKILLLTAPMATRLTRVRERGWDAAELRRRDAAIAGKTYSVNERSINDKIMVIKNDGEISALAAVINDALNNARPN